MNPKQDVYYHRLFTYAVKSDIPLIDDRIAPLDEPDITVYRIRDKAELTYTGKSFIQLDMPNFARCFINQGREIAYLLYEDAKEDDIRLFILASCMGAVLFQHDYIVLHGNAVTWDNETCTIFLGEKGAGKSTQAAWHYQQGASLVADDICAITFDGRGRPMVLPSYPQLKLWQNTADLLGIETQPLTRVRQHLDKFFYPTHDRFAQKPCLVRKIYEIDNTISTPSRITGVEKMLSLQQHTYRYFFLGMMGSEREYLQHLMILANKIELNKVPRLDIHALSREKYYVAS